MRSTFQNASSRITATILTLYLPLSYLYSARPINLLGSNGTNRWRIFEFTSDDLIAVLQETGAPAVHRMHVEFSLNIPHLL